MPYAQDDTLQVRDVWVCERNCKLEVWDAAYACSFSRFDALRRSFTDLRITTLATTQSKHVHAAPLCGLPGATKPEIGTTTN